MDARTDLPIPAQRDRRSPTDRDLRGLLHDVGHGLATVALLLDTIRSDVAPGSRLLDLVEAETTRLLAAVHDGLRSGRSDQPVAVRTLLQQVAELADRTRSTTVTLLPGDDDLVLWIDPVVLWRVVINLVDNAVRAAGPDGHVHLVVSGSGDGAVIEVVDDGPGFPHGASGTAHLGLEVVTRLLASCGGGLEILDLHPHGTRARVVLTADRSPITEGVDRARPGAL